MSKILNGIEIPEKTVFEDIFERNKNNLDSIALEFYGNQITYRQFFDEVKSYAKAYSDLGVRIGDRVTLCMPGTVEFIVSYYALNYIGATANCVSINFLRDNIKKYTDDKDSDVLVIFDKFWDIINRNSIDFKAKNVILTSIYDYMPENIKSSLPKGSELKPSEKEFIYMKDFIEIGKKADFDISKAEYDSKRDNVFLYTSGTTGNPKCVVFKDISPVALVKMHENLPINDRVGDRSLLIIPPYYATSLFYEVNLQLARGLTIVLQPNYDKNTFASNLRDLKINRTLAAMSHYAALFKSDLKRGDLSNLKIPGCGGEPVTYNLAKKINDLLFSCGAQGSMIIGGGQTENGSCIFEGYTVENRVNETGNPLPGVNIKIVDPSTGLEVSKGERGELLVSSPAAMDRYYEDEKSTSEYFFYDENGIRWGQPKDIAFQNPNGTYRMLGRANDSLLVNNKRVYMFDTEEEVSKDDAILECEAISLPINSKNDCVQLLHIVINPNYEESKLDVIKRLSSLENIGGVKIRDSFGTSEITGKRDAKALLKERNGYYIVRNNQLIECEFPYDESIIEKEVNEEEFEINNNNIILVKTNA